MSLLLDTQYLEGFVTEEELARCAGPLAAAGEALAAGDGAPKGWRTLPEGFPEPLLRQLADTGRRRGITKRSRGFSGVCLWVG